jgi:hypothetical protein
MTYFQIKTTICRTSLILAVAVFSFSALSTSSFAFSSEAQQMCTGDAMRLCSSEIPNVSRITACMRKQRANLSAGCRTVLERDLARQSGKVAAE